MMAILGTIIGILSVIAVYLGLWYTFDNTRIKAELGYTDVVFDDGDPRFGGVTLTNVGVPDIVIRGAIIAEAIPIAEPDLKGRYIGIGRVKEYYGRQLSTLEPNHRLRTGDRIEVIYNLDDLATQLKSGQRIRHELWDSFGNRYVSGWVDYYATPNGNSVHEFPNEGFRAPEIPKKSGLLGMFG